MASSQPAFPASCTGHRSPLEQLSASRGRTTDRETMTTTGGDSGGPPQRDGPWERADLRLARPAGLSGQSICRASSRSRRGDVPGERRRVPSAPRRLTLPGHPHSAYQVPSPALLALTGLLDSPSPARGRTCLPQPSRRDARSCRRPWGAVGRLLTSRGQGCVTAAPSLMFVTRDRPVSPGATPTARRCLVSRDNFPVYCDQ